MIVTEAIRHEKRASAPKTEKARKRTATRGEAKRCLGVVFRVTLSLARSLLTSECEGDSAGMPAKFCLKARKRTAKQA